jgi:hypothetical protein
VLAFTGLPCKGYTAFDLVGRAEFEPVTSSVSVQGQPEVIGLDLTIVGGGGEPGGLVVRRRCCHFCCQAASDP